MELRADRKASSSDHLMDKMLTKSNLSSTSWVISYTKHTNEYIINITSSFEVNNTPISYDRIFNCEPFFSRPPQAALERLALMDEHLTWNS